MDGRRGLGARAEEAVTALFMSGGARVLARNWRAHPRGGEVDLVARQGRELLFVEVKARRRGRPRDLVPVRQRRRLLAAVEAWLAVRPHKGPVRLVMALVTVDPDGLVEDVSLVPLA